MRRKLVVGNWKMHGSLVANSTLLTEIKVAIEALHTLHCDVALCVPAPYFAQCEAELNKTIIAWGGQDVSAHMPGAYTGEVAIGMLTDFSCRYVIVGHSERRTLHGEDNLLVAQKALRAIQANVIPIVCVGETLDQRANGQTYSIVEQQLAAVLEKVDRADLNKIVLAYEPVWAIGTGQTATPEQVQAVHMHLRAQLAQKNPENAVTILYGGSMKPENAAQLLAMPDIDGGLIGGASLKAADFVSIIAAAG